MISPRFPLPVALIALLGWVAGAEPETPPRNLRFLPVGEVPPFRQEIRDGVRYELEPPPGSLPPHQVTVAAQGLPASPAATLQLGRISSAVRAPVAPVIDVRPADVPPDAPNWLRVVPPPAGDFMVFVWRKPAGSGWGEAATLTVPDGPAGMPAGSVCIVNLFPQAANLRWNGQPILLRSGSHIVRRLATGEQAPFQILVADAQGRMKRYFSATVTQNPGERGWVALYRADGNKPRRPLKVLTLREPVAPAGPPEAGKTSR